MRGWLSMNTKMVKNNLAGIAVTRAALEGLPKFEGTVYRGDKKAFFNAYQPGAIVTRDGFTSTAKKKYDGSAETAN
jgi:hypothetical protein